MSVTPPVFVQAVTSIRCECARGDAAVHIGRAADHVIVLRDCPACGRTLFHFNGLPGRSDLEVLAQVGQPLGP